MGGPSGEKLRGVRLFSCASFTRMFLPSSSWPSSFCAAAAAVVPSANSTNANPRGRPLLRSVGTNTLTTSPTSPKRRSRSPCVVSKLRFPMNSFGLMARSFHRAS